MGCAGTARHEGVRRGLLGVAKGAAAGLIEHLVTWPLVRFLPRVNLWGNHRAFAQAVWRHLPFGAILGTLEESLTEGYADGAPA